MPSAFDREVIRNWIQDATGLGLSVDDALPDTLAAGAEALGLAPAVLRTWIFDQPRGDWSVVALQRWARRFDLAVESPSWADDGGALPGISQNCDTGVKP